MSAQGALITYSVALCAESRVGNALLIFVDGDGRVDRNAFVFVTSDSMLGQLV